MPDYGHDLLFGTFSTPAADPPLRVVDLAMVADRAGLDLVTFQDHPYQPTYHDAWTLLAYVASRTTRVRLAGNVLNLPLRDPALLARASASLDRLSGGRFDLGIGAGAFWDGIAAMGGRRLSPGQSVAALGEAIEIIRQIWDTESPGRVNVNGSEYQVAGVSRGPAPAHTIPIWIGAYKPRMLRLVGQVADGWLPSLAYLPEGPSELTAMNARIDEAAEEAGRNPTAVRRLLNVSGQFASNQRGFLAGPPAQWASELAELALDYGISAFILATDDARMIEMFATDVAPETREIVQKSRTGLRAESLPGDPD